MLNQTAALANACYNHVACEQSSYYGEEYNLRTYVKGTATINS